MRSGAVERDADVCVSLTAAKDSYLDSYLDSKLYLAIALPEDSTQIAWAMGR